MTTVSIFDFRNNLAQYLRMVEEGEELNITRFDKPVANITPPKAKGKKSLLDFKGFMGKGGETGEEYLNRVRRSKPGFN